MVYSLLGNYSYETFYCCWAESLPLAQISMVYYESAPKIMSRSEKLGFIGQSDAFFKLVNFFAVHTLMTGLAPHMIDPYS